MPHQKIFNFSFAAGHSHLCVFTYFWDDTPVCWEKCFLHHFPSEYDNFVCIYSFLFASMVQWWTLDIHWTFALGTRFLWKIVLPIIIMFLTLRKFFFELFTERFFEEPKMVLLWHHCENPLLLLWANYVVQFMNKWFFEMSHFFQSVVQNFSNSPSKILLNLKE